MQCMAPSGGSHWAGGFHIWRKESQSMERYSHLGWDCSELAFDNSWRQQIFMETKNTQLTSEHGANHLQQSNEKKTNVPPNQILEGWWEVKKTQKTEAASRTAPRNPHTAHKHTYANKKISISFFSGKQKTDAQKMEIKEEKQQQLHLQWSRWSQYLRMSWMSKSPHSPPHSPPSKWYRGDRNLPRNLGGMGRHHKQAHLVLDFQRRAHHEHCVAHCAHFAHHASFDEICLTFFIFF